MRMLAAKPRGPRKARGGGCCQYTYMHPRKPSAHAHMHAWVSAQPLRTAAAWPCAVGPGGHGPCWAAAGPSYRGQPIGIAMGLCTAGVGRTPLPATCPVPWLASGMGRRRMPLQMSMHGTVYAYASLRERSIHLSCYLI